MNHSINQSISYTRKCIVKWFDFGHCSMPALKVYYCSWSQNSDTSEPVCGYGENKRCGQLPIRDLKHLCRTNTIVSVKMEKKKHSISLLLTNGSVGVEPLTI
jgi:hypothetical protein